MPPRIERPSGPWISPRKVARRLGVSEMMVYKWAVLGKFRALEEVGENIRFHAEDVERFAESLETAAV